MLPCCTAHECGSAATVEIRFRMKMAIEAGGSRAKRIPSVAMLEFSVGEANYANWSSRVKITREDVERVAELAYLELSETELESYRKQIDEILEYIGKLDELDTTQVTPMAQVLAGDQTADATLREDVVAPCGVADEILKQAPDPEPPYFRVPKVIER